MALPLVVDSLDDVTEAARGAYVEKDGKFHLDVEVEDTTGLKKALNSERQLRANHEKQVKAWQSLGKTPEEIQEMLAEQARKEEEIAKKSGDFEKLLKQHQDKAAQERAAIESELKVARDSERQAVIGERLLSALSRAGITEEGTELLPDKLASRIKFETVDGRRVLKIMQADGETPMAGSGADGTATLDDLVAEAVKKYPSQFKGSGGGGGGKQPDGGGGGKPPINGVPTSYADCKTDAERVAFLKAKREKAA